MKKIMSLFCRNYDGNRQVRDEVVTGAEWVITGEGTAYRKWDGTACMVLQGRLWKRYDVKKGRTPPPGWEQCQEPDPVSGHWPGWVPVGEGPEDKWFREAFQANPNVPDGTYELVGPKVNGGKDGFPKHVLAAHDSEPLPDAPRDFDGIRAYLSERKIEGIVWHHPDGRMVKIKARDFGLPW